MASNLPLMHVAPSYGWSAEKGNTTTYKLVNNDRLSSVIESNARWETEEMAEVFCALVNAGMADVLGMKFASYADD